jgi:hypothetical protein
MITNCKLVIVPAREALLGFLFEEVIQIAAFLVRVFFVGRAVHTSVYSPGTGESGARARLASRNLKRGALVFVSTSCLDKIGARLT